MQLIYCRGAQLNFGDDLNAELWPALAPALFAEPGRDGFLGIGTIVGMRLPPCDRLHIFSSGAGYDPLTAWAPSRRVWCVRGPLTARLLDADDAALTDGALLLPDLLGISQAADAAGVGVMPHWQSLLYPGWQAACDAAGYRLISPMAAPRDVVTALASTRLVLTESLHGAILADALGIPWVPLSSSRNVAVFKWVDWALSVGLNFAPVFVPHPSAQAPLHFGRPEPALWGRQRSYDAAAALAEYQGRLAFAEAAATTPPGGLAGVKNWLKRQAACNAMGARLLGHHPGRTAAALQQAARITPNLSGASHRDSLKNRLHERLEALQREALSVGVSA